MQSPTSERLTIPVPPLQCPFLVLHLCHSVVLIAAIRGQAVSWRLHQVEFSTFTFTSIQDLTSSLAVSETGFDSPWKYSPLNKFTRFICQIRVPIHNLNIFISSLSFFSWLIKWFTIRNFFHGPEYFKSICNNSYKPFSVRDTFVKETSVLA